MIPFHRLKNKIISSSLFKDSFWALTGNVFGKGLALVTSIIIAKLLGKDLFGMYGLVRTTLLSVAVFTTFGLGYTATKYIAEFTQNSSHKIFSLIKNVMQITITAAFLCAGLTFLFSRQLSSYLEVPDLYTSLRYLSIIIIFNSITTTQTGVLAGLKKFKQIARINLTNGIVSLILSVPLTYLNGLNGALFALLFSQIIICVQFYLETRKAIKALGISKPVENFNIRRELIVFSLPVALQEMVYSIHSWLIPLLIVKLSSFGEIGIYTAAAQWSSLILFLPGTLRNVILSHVSSETGRSGYQARILSRMLVVNFISTLIPCLIVFSLSGLITNFYGPSFSGLAAVLNFSVFTTIFSTMSNVIKQYFLAIEKAWFTLWTRIANVIFALGLFLILMHFGGYGFGALRMAQANLITQICFFVYWYFMYIKFKNATN